MHRHAHVYTLCACACTNLHQFFLRAHLLLYELKFKISHRLYLSLRSYSTLCNLVKYIIQIITLLCIVNCSQSLTDKFNSLRSHRILSEFVAEQQKKAFCEDNFFYFMFSQRIQQNRISTVKLNFFGFFLAFIWIHFLIII